MRKGYLSFIFQRKHETYIFTQEVPHGQYIKKILIDFTDEKITPSGGSFFLAHVSHLLGLPHLLNTLKLKKRNRGSSGQPILLSLIYTLANGDGAIIAPKVIEHQLSEINHAAEKVEELAGVPT